MLIFYILFFNFYVNFNKEITKNYIYLFTVISKNNDN